jgi:hypothetical protein
MLSRTEPTNGDCLCRNREKTAEASRMRGDVALAAGKIEALQLHANVRM